MCEKILLADGATIFMMVCGVKSFSEVWSPKFWMFRMWEIDIADDYIKLVRSQDRPQDQGEELIEINLVEA